MSTRTRKSKKSDSKPVERASSVRFRFDQVGHTLIDYLHQAFKDGALHQDDTIEGVYPLAPVFRLVKNPHDEKALRELLRQDPKIIFHPVVWSCIRDILHAAYWEEGTSSYELMEEYEEYHASLIQTWIEAYLPGFTLQKKTKRGPRPPSGYDLDIQWKIRGLYDDLMETAEDQMKRGMLKPTKNLTEINCQPSKAEQLEPSKFETRMVKKLQTAWMHSHLSDWPVPAKAESPSKWVFAYKKVSLPNDEIVNWVRMVTDNKKNLDFRQYRSYFAYYMIAYYLEHRTRARPKKKESDKAEWVRTRLQSYRQSQKRR